MALTRCPRCGFSSYENLSTHSHCVDCNYSPDLDREQIRQIPDWAIQAIRSMNEKKVPTDSLAQALERAA